MTQPLRDLPEGVTHISVPLSVVWDQIADHAAPQDVGNDVDVTALLAKQPLALLTKKALADLLSISTRTVDRLFAAGMLPTPTVVVSGRKRWDPEVVRRWLASKPRLTTRGKGVSHAK